VPKEIMMDSSTGMLSGLALGTLVCLAVLLYFTPFLVAAGRQHHQLLAIGMLNLFAGWTLLGWVGALVWACTRPAVIAPPPQIHPPRNGHIFPRLTVRDF
jgi:hypothetical protein